MVLSAEFFRNLVQVILGNQAGSGVFDVHAVCFVLAERVRCKVFGFEPVVAQDGDLIALSIDPTRDEGSEQQDIHTSQDVRAVGGDDEAALRDGVEENGKSVDDFFLGEGVEVGFRFFDDKKLAAVFQADSKEQPL